MGRSAAGIWADVARSCRNAPLAMGAPGGLQEGTEAFFIVPAYGATRLCSGQHVGHGAVYLPYPQHRPAGRQVLEQLAGQDGPVLRVVPQRQ